MPLVPSTSQRPQLSKMTRLTAVMEEFVKLAFLGQSANWRSRRGLTRAFATLLNPIFSDEEVVRVLYRCESRLLKHYKIGISGIGLLKVIRQTT